MVLHGQEIQKPEYHIHFIVRYPKNYALHGHVRTLKSRSVFFNANSKLLSKVLRIMPNSAFT
jgi:hypothetical protein